MTANIEPKNYSQWGKALTETFVNANKSVAYFSETMKKFSVPLLEQANQMSPTSNSEKVEALERMIIGILRQCEGMTITVPWMDMSDSDGRVLEITQVKDPDQFIFSLKQPEPYQ